jgi:hypothetical protein
LNPVYNIPQVYGDHVASPGGVEIVGSPLQGMLGDKTGPRNLKAIEDHKATENRPAWRFLVKGVLEKGGYFMNQRP